MKQHKWAKEIKAWADGAEIEVKPFGCSLWTKVTSLHPTWDLDNEYRIKPTPKEPQYLYVYKEPKSDCLGFKTQVFITTEKGLYFSNPPIGKIKLEDE